MDTETAPRGAPNRRDRRAGAARERRGQAAQPLPNAFSFTVADACRMAGIGQTLVYKLAKEDRLRLLKAGGRTLVCGDSLRALVAGRDA
ncbi:MAG: helix-turn-helix domain-containing protein [Acetobacteraceae bacterium]|nr:helix-turn-helix domain-containing protein [Acetobacteraceae bacterium]